MINDGLNDHINHKGPFSSDHLEEQTNLSISRDLGQPSAYRGEAKNLEKMGFDRNRNNLIVN